MFVAWSGWGILVIPIVVVVAGAVVVLGQGALAAVGRPDLVFLAFSAGLLVAAVVNWRVGRTLNGRPGRELVDARTGERVVLRRVHRLFWIRMEYWSVPVAMAAVVALLPLLGLGRG